MLTSDSFHHTPGSAAPRTNERQYLDCSIRLLLSRFVHAIFSLPEAARRRHPDPHGRSSQSLVRAPEHTPPTGVPSRGATHHVRMESCHRLNSRYPIINIDVSLRPYDIRSPSGVSTHLVLSLRLAKTSPSAENILSACPISPIYILEADE